jgi:hypothetical protein
MVAIVVVAGFTLVQVDDVVLGPTPTSLNACPFFTISLPHVGEALGLLATIASTLNVRSLKIGYASIVMEGGGYKGRGRVAIGVPLTTIRKKWC